MRVAFIISFVANLILTLVALVSCPSNVAIHFGVGGEPDNWAPAYVNALIMSGVHLLIFVSFFFTPHLIRITPPRLINLPNKRYWLKEENRGRMESILTSQLYQFGALTFVLMFIVGLLALHANLSDARVGSAPIPGNEG